VLYHDWCIRILAGDHVLVTKIQVMILDRDGRVSEQGKAIRADGDWWD
jgi:hypothetical protein